MASKRMTSSKLFCFLFHTFHTDEVTHPFKSREHSMADVRQVKLNVDTDIDMLWSVHKEKDMI